MNHCLLWSPDYLARSAGQAHVPLMFWLVDLLKPRQTLSLGGAEGVVHAAICQAAARNALNCDCRVHLLHPANERFIRHISKHYADFSLPVGDLADIEEQSVDVITIHVTSSERAKEIDWDAIYGKLAETGVCVIYGPSLEQIPRHALHGAEQKDLLHLGESERAARLVLGTKAPSVLRELIENHTAKSDLEKLLSHRADFLEQANAVRDFPPLMPDPTAPEFVEPMSLDEARAQIAHLIELHATDLETLAARLEQERTTQNAREEEHLSDVARMEEELKRKDVMLEALNQKVSELSAEPQQQRAPAGPLSLLKRVVHVMSGRNVE